VLRDGKCRTCLAATGWAAVDTLPKTLAWLDLDRLTRTVPQRGWERFGLCAGRGFATFHPAKGDPTVTMTKARAICKGCPVVYACLATALAEQSSTLEEHGVWGRTSVTERRKIRRVLRARAEAA
jgi:hypothetical protein